MPLYVQLAEQLRERIDSGQIPAGRAIPSRKQLAQEFEVGQNTALRAVRLLQEEGILETVLGKGIYVVPPSERRR